jgi:hypothetical protein
MTTPLNATVASRYKFQVNTGTIGVPIWTDVRGVMEFTPGDPDPVLQDDSDYDSVAADNITAWKSQKKTALQWTITAKIKRGFVGSTTGYDPGQEFLRTAANAMGAAGVVQVRYYDRVPGTPEAYMGSGEVSFKHDGAAMDALSTATITVTGRGILTPIANPAA